MEVSGGKQIFRIGVIVDPPYAYECFFNASISCEGHGFGVELAEVICSTLRDVHCQFIRLQGLNYGVNTSGVWDGAIADMIHNEIDASLPIFASTPIRLDVVNFSEPVLRDFNVAVALSPSPSPPFIQGFAASTWIMVTFTCLLVGTLLILLSSAGEKYAPKYMRKDFWMTNDQNTDSRNSVMSKDDFTCSDRSRGRVNVRKRKLVNEGFSGLAVFTRQTGTRHLPNKASYVLLGSWCLACVLLDGIYSSTIVSTVLDPSEKIAFRDVASLADCIRRKGCKIKTRSLSQSYFEKIYSATEGELLLLRHAVKENPIEEERTDRTWAHIRSGHPPDYITVTFESQMDFGLIIPLYPPCSFLGQSFSEFNPVGMPVKKHEPILDRINVAITTMKKTGIIDHLYRKYIGYAIQAQKLCGSEKKKEEPLSLRVFVWTLYILLVGVAVAGLMLSLENLFHRSLIFNSFNKTNQKDK